MKKRHVIGLSVVLVILIVSGIAFATSITPYITLDEAKTKSKIVKVYGTFGEVLSQEDGIIFDLTDEAGTVAQVVYHGPKPANMEHADGVVVEGKFDGDTFVAKELYVKCPSKYESQIEGESQ